MNNYVNGKNYDYEVLDKNSEFSKGDRLIVERTVLATHQNKVFLEKVPVVVEAVENDGVVKLAHKDGNYFMRFVASRGWVAGYKRRQKRDHIWTVRDVTSDDDYKAVRRWLR